jgi:hypothetical protein
MSNPSQPYKLGNGKSVGDAAAKAGAEIGTAISEGVQAITGVKKHRNTLTHLAEQAKLNRKHVTDTLNQSAEIAERLGGKTKISTTAEGAVDFAHKAKKNKNKNRNLSAAQHDTDAPGEVKDAAAAASSPRKVAGSFRAPGAPKPVPRGSGAGVRSGAVAKPETVSVKPMGASSSDKSAELKPSNADKMRTFNERKKSAKGTASPWVGRKKTTVAGKKYGSSMPTILGSLDQSRETTNKNVDKAWAYAANKRKQDKKKGN